MTKQRKTTLTLFLLTGALLVFLLGPVQAGELLVHNGESIAFMGDSITQEGAEMPGGYVQLVVSGLKANGVTVTPIPRGTGGHTSADMIGRIGEVLGNKPNWVTLSYGVNDVNRGANGGIPLDKFKVNVTAVVEQAQAAGVKVMLLTATMIGGAGSEGNLKLAGYNDFLRQLAKDKNCQLADLNADMLAATQSSDVRRRLLTRDGIHMYPFGNQMMATGVLKAFGMDESQLQKARNFWLNMPEVACRIPVSLSLTLRQYEQLTEAAAKENRSIDDWIATKVLATLPQPEVR